MFGLAGLASCGFGLGTAATDDPPGGTALRDLELAEVCSLARSGADGERACSCAAGPCWSTVGCAGDAFALAVGDAVPLAAPLAVCCARGFFFASLRSSLASVTLCGFGLAVTTDDPSGATALLDVESAETWDLACFGSAGELVCSCVPGDLRSAAGVTGNAFEPAAGDTAASASGGDHGLTGGAGAVTGEAVTTGAPVALADDASPGAGARD